MERNFNGNLKKAIGEFSKFLPGETEFEIRDFKIDVTEDRSYDDGDQNHRHHDFTCEVNGKIIVRFKK